MIEGLKPYPAYKDSGVPWLGQVPEHWAALRLRNVARLLVSNVDKKSEEDEIPVRLCNYVDVYKRDFITAEQHFMKATATSAEIAQFCLAGDDVLITKDSEDWKDIGVPSYVAKAANDLICGYHLAILRPRLGVMSGRFLYWHLLAQAVRTQFSIGANGVTRYGLSQGAIKQVQFAVPPIPEQLHISNFLAQFYARLGRYIAAKRKLIRLLEEEKQAIIQRAVTRGIDPDVRLKPSGIDWLGDIPKHWNVRRNFALFFQRREFRRSELPIYSVSLRTGMLPITEEGETKRKKRLIQNLAAYQVARKGDIAYNMMRMWQGALGTALEDCLVSPAYVVAAPRAHTYTDYFALLFRTREYKNEVNRASRGIVPDRNRLYWDRFKALPAPVPPFEEQRNIVVSVDQRIARLNDAIADARRGIELVTEFRTRLISDVVTGKLDVREAAANLPDDVGTDLPLDAEEEPVDEETDADDPPVPEAA